MAPSIDTDLDFDGEHMVPGSPTRHPHGFAFEVAIKSPDRANTRTSCRSRLESYRQPRSSAMLGSNDTIPGSPSDDAGSPSVSLHIVGGFTGEPLCTIEADSSYLVRDLKRAIREQEGTPVSSQCLVLGSQLLQDSEKPVEAVATFAPPAAPVLQHSSFCLSAELKLVRKRYFSRNWQPSCQLRTRDGATGTCEVAERARVRNERKQQAAERARLEQQRAREAKRLRLEQDQAAKQQRRKAVEVERAGRASRHNEAVMMRAMKQRSALHPTVSSRCKGLGDDSAKP
eukprot:TRINITY_DN52609_c0_g1_i1.p1 TRINITY_DN52609_c0_g1~~TRINITY_DN52609_c0_g1_i1.p1  ORF type:complete len:295 (+),score=58.73 TRINITY_DN52609_c0_g1_i1:30-887(+)